MATYPTIGSVESSFLTIATGQNPLHLRRGGVLKDAHLAFETYGELNHTKSNAILLFHALTGSQHAAGYNTAVSGVNGLWTEDCHVGWWNEFIGPGRALDTSKYFVICANYLGGCYGSTGPSSVNPDTGKPWGGSFPWISLADIVDSQVRILDHLGIETLHAVIGGSLGGMMVLSLATRYPERVRLVIPVASGAEVTALQRIMNFEQICALEHDPAFQNGDYYETGKRPDAGMALARMISHKTFVSLETIQQRARGEVRTKEAFGQYELTHPIESYMLHQGSKFVKRFDPNSYLAIMGIWQSFDLLGDSGCESFVDVFKPCHHQRYMVFSVDSDACYYPEEQQKLVRHLRLACVPVRHITVSSEKGHDSFLLEPELFTPHLKHTLEEDWE